MPKIIVSDLVMPDMDGRTFLALLRSSSTARIPVLIVSAASRGVERELEREGAEAVLDKSWGADTIAEFAGMVAAKRVRPVVTRGSPDGGFVLTHAAPGSRP
jgi:CheY-like chemotaxis protein